MILGSLTTIGTLQRGDRFVLAYQPTRKATVERVGTGSALVRYDGKRHRKFEAKSGDTVVATPEFDEPIKPITVSLGTEVFKIESE